jgi:hypothetical protein
MSKKDKCNEKDIVRVCSRYGFNSRFCKKKIKSCSR